MGLWLCALPVHAQDISGTAGAADGATLTIAGRNLALTGIRAPKPGTTCIINGKTQDCGGIARTALLDLVAGAQVRCKADKGGRHHCLANGYDLSEGMVYVGWAIAETQAPARYAKVMAKARAKRHGFWRAADAGALTAGLLGGGR